MYSIVGRHRGRQSPRLCYRQARRRSESSSAAPRPAVHQRRHPHRRAEITRRREITSHCRPPGPTRLGGPPCRPIDTRTVCALVAVTGDNISRLLPNARAQRSVPFHVRINSLRPYVCTQYGAVMDSIAIVLGTVALKGGVDMRSVYDALHYTLCPSVRRSCSASNAGSSTLANSFAMVYRFESENSGAKCIIWMMDPEITPI